MKEVIKEIKIFIKENFLLTLLFIFSTLFFLIQHYFDFSWDFAAYLINAKYFFYGGNYFEVYRAPIISLILGPLLILGRVAPYIYILLVSILFFYSTKKLSDTLLEKYFYKYKIKKEMLNLLFYFFNLNIFVLIFGMTAGTELLALSFFQLFITCFILNKNSGHWLALAFLSRYNFFIFIPFLFFNKNIKKIIKNIGLFFIVIFPWLLFNKITWGNWFASVADSFYLNVFSRLGRVEIFHFSSLINVTNWFLPFIILGLFVPFIIMFKSKNKKISNYKYEVLFIVIFLFFLYDVYTIPFKVVRYLFNLVLPITFFSVLGTIFIIKNIKKEYLKKLFIIVLILGLLISMVILGQQSFKISSEDKMYKEAANSITKLGLNKCEILSNHWVPVNYYSGNVRYFTYYVINESLRRGEIILLFYNNPTIDDTFTKEELENSHQLVKTKDYLILADENITSKSCKQSESFYEPLIKNPCEILSKKFNSKTIGNTFLKICKSIN